MMCFRWQLALVLIGFLATSSHGAITVYEFDNESRRDQFNELIEELRCPKCQNQNIADSDAGVAKLIKDRVYKLTQEGKTKDEITDHMIDRYGDFVTYRPPLKTSTFFLWFGPVLGFLIAVMVLVTFVRSNNRKAAALSAAEQQRVRELLSKYNPEDSDSSSPQ